MCAVIGRKGSGKSALADILGLLGNTKQAEDDLSFLTRDKFKKSPENKAKHFEAELLWFDDSTVPKNLNDNADHTSQESMQYIPQNFLEKICTDIAHQAGGFFDKELESVIFSHVDSSGSLGRGNLQDLIAYRTQETNNGIQLLQEDLSIVNGNIALVESKQKPDFKATLKNSIKVKTAELTAVLKTPLNKVEKPQEGAESNDQIKEVQKQLEEYKAALSKTEKILSRLHQGKTFHVNRLTAASNLLELLKNVKIYHNSISQDLLNYSQAIGIDSKDIIAFTTVRLK